VRPKLAYVLALVLLVAGCIEAMAYVADRVLADQALLFRPSAGTVTYARYLAEREPVLGWPGSGALGHHEVDASGSRLVPAFPDAASPLCAAAFGDSFTWGGEVSPAEAYPNVLSQTLGCRVANYGVEGYGTDQAVLRYERLSPPAPVVVLGHYADNILRNVNQDRAFLTNEPFGLKPRFILDGETLRLIPLPVVSEDDYRHLDERAEALLPDDYFRPGGPGGVSALRFPFVVTALRVLRHFRARAALARVPSYAPFYDPGHPSRALPVTAAILERFVATARARGQRPVVLLIPDVKDLERLRAHRPVSYQPLAEALAARQLPVLSAAQPLVDALADRAPCALYSRCSGGHFRPEGYRLLAQAVARALR
jgi:hypothetical protein